MRLRPQVSFAVVAFVAFNEVLTPYPGLQTFYNRFKALEKTQDNDCKENTMMAKHM